jgi:transposase, IS5 family
VTPANIHGSQMLPMLLDPENADDYVWADTAYIGECFENLLNFAVLKVAFTKKATTITR